MNKRIRNKWLIALGLGLTVFATQAWAAGGVPGSTDDPVVTKSYVDQQIQQVAGGGNRLIVEELHAGQTLYGYEGTEFIVRTGKVIAVAGLNGDGLTDITAGADLRGGAAVQTNHLLLIARSDSRGLRLAPNDNGVAYVMIRGNYEIK